MSEQPQAREAQLLAALSLAVAALTREGLAYANPAAERLLGVSAPAAGAPGDVLGPGPLADAVSRAADTGETAEVETVVSGRDVVGRASPLGEGEVALIIRDVTEARRLERIRRDFVLNASHELKTPAAGMRALAESIALAVDQDPPRARRMIDRLQSEAERLSQLVRDLLDLARMEEASAQGVRTRVDVAEVVRAHIERYQAAAAERGVTLTCECEGVTIAAVPEDVRLIVDNLVENAVRYNTEGGTVHVRTRLADGSAEVTVADTGVGIPEGEHGRVFERFYRVDRARSRAAGGTGLGLSLVRNAAQRHGGEVAIDSRPGEGSTFTVRLPVGA